MPSTTVITAPSEVSNPAAQAFPQTMPAQQSVIYRPAGVRGGNVYTTLPLLDQVCSEMTGPFDLVFDPTGTGDSTCHLTGTLALSQYARWLVAPGSEALTAVTIDNGCVLQSKPMSIDVNVVSNSNNAAIVGSGSDTWDLDIGRRAPSSIACAGTAHFVSGVQHLNISAGARMNLLHTTSPVFGATATIVVAFLELGIGLNIATLTLDAPSVVYDQNTFAGANLTQVQGAATLNTNISGGSGGAVVFDDSVSGTKSNITTSRALPSAIDNTKTGITNLGSDSTGSATGATQNYATIIGGNACVASALYAIAGGNASAASAQGAVALGDGAVAGGLGSVSLGGSNGNANGTGEVTIGRSNSPSGSTGSVTIGDDNTAGSAGAVVIGSNNEADGVNSAAIGGNNSCAGDGSLAMGDNNSTHSAQGSIALGKSCTAYGIGGAAIGNNCFSHGQGVTIGNGNDAQADGSAAIGVTNDATDIGSVAMGSGATATGVGAIAMGQNVITANPGDVALGVNSSTGNNGSGLGGSVCIGFESESDGVQGCITIGYQCTGDNNAQVSIGSSCECSVAGPAVSIGGSCQANGRGHVALGDTCFTSGSSGLLGEVAIGSNCNVGGGNGTIAIGHACMGSGGIGAVALGDTCSASAQSAVAMGSNNQTTAEASVATGEGTRIVNFGERQHFTGSGSTTHCAIGDFTYRGQVASATPGSTGSMTLGNATLFTFAANYVYSIDMVSTISSSGNATHVQTIKQQLIVKNIAGTVTLQSGTPASFGDSAGATWTVTATITSGQLTLTASNGSDGETLNIGTACRYSTVAL